MMLLFTSMFSFSGTKKAWVSFHLCHSSKFSLACLGFLSQHTYICDFQAFWTKEKAAQWPLMHNRTIRSFHYMGFSVFLFILSPICSSFYLEMSKELKSAEKYREYDLYKSTCFFPQFSLTFTEFKKSQFFVPLLPVC